MNAFDSLGLQVKLVVFVFSDVVYIVSNLVDITKWTASPRGLMIAELCICLLVIAGIQSAPVNICDVFHGASVGVAYLGFAEAFGGCDIASGNQLDGAASCQCIMLLLNQPCHVETLSLGEVGELI